MPITPDRLTRLREFGLSEYAARAYLALLDLGVAEARDVSTLSKVPQAKIYHVLEQLHDKGLATILPEFPKKYAPVPFADYLNRIHDEHERAAQAIQRDREVLEDMFRVIGDTDIGNRGFFTVVRGRRNVIAKIQEMLHDAKEDMLVLGTSGLSLRYPHFLPELTQAKESGVRLRILAPFTPATLEKLEALGNVVEIRARMLDEGAQTSRVAILTVDHARAFLINFLPDDDNLYNGKDIGVFTDQEAMVRALEGLVDAQWAHAAPLSEAGSTAIPRASHARALDLVRDAVLIARPEGDIVLQNVTSRALLGDVTGLALSDVLPEAVALSAAKPANVRTTTALPRDGEAVKVEATAGRIPDAEGGELLVLTLREIVEPERAVDVRIEGERAPQRR